MPKKSALVKLKRSKCNSYIQISFLYILKQRRTPLVDEVEEAEVSRIDIPSSDEDSDSSSEDRGAEIKHKKSEAVRTIAWPQVRVNAGKLSIC